MTATAHRTTRIAGLPRLPSVDAYAEAVSSFLHRALDEAPSEADRQAAELVLSNPFDLTFAADLLAQGFNPSATSLIDEAFRLADKGAAGEPGYRAVAGQPFPLTRFGTLAVAMRLEDRNWFKPDEFAPELPYLLRRRLLVQRALRGPSGAEEERIQFRHDRVWDFFIAAAFLEDPDLWAEHLATWRRTQAREWDAVGRTIGGRPWRAPMNIARSALPNGVCPNCV